MHDNHMHPRSRESTTHAIQDLLARGAPVSSLAPLAGRPVEVPQVGRGVAAARPVATGALAADALVAAWAARPSRALLGALRAPVPCGRGNQVPEAESSGRMAHWCVTTPMETNAHNRNTSLAALHVMLALLRSPDAQQQLPGAIFLPYDTGEGVQNDIVRLGSKRQVADVEMGRPHPSTVAFLKIKMLYKQKCMLHTNMISSDAISILGKSNISRGKKT